MFPYFSTNHKLLKKFIFNFYNQTVLIAAETSRNNTCNFPMIYGCINLANPILLLLHGYQIEINDVITGRVPLPASWRARDNSPSLYNIHDNPACHLLRSQSSTGNAGTKSSRLGNAV